MNPSRQQHVRTHVLVVGRGGGGGGAEEGRGRESPARAPHLHSLLTTLSPPTSSLEPGTLLPDPAGCVCGAAAVLSGSRWPVRSSRGEKL